jgi:hypothetical protein
MSAVGAELAGSLASPHAQPGAGPASAQTADRAEEGSARPPFGVLVSDVRQQHDRAAWLLQRLGEGAIVLRDVRAAAAAAATGAVRAVTAGEAHAETEVAQASAQGRGSERSSHGEREIAARETELLLLLVELRIVHRDLHVGAHAANAALEPLKKRLEAGRLEFENLAYEREMLRREITLLQSRKALDLEALGLAPPQTLSGLRRGATATDDGRVTQPHQAAPDSNAEPAARSPPALPSDAQVEERPSRAPSSDAPCSTPASRSSRMSEGHEIDGVAAPSVAGESDGRTISSREAPSERKHAEFLHMLEHELEERRRLSQVAKQVKCEHESVKARNESQIKFLQNLPSRIKQVLRAVEPLHSFFDDEHGTTKSTLTQSPLVAKDEAGTLRDFPQPLYVLAREAIAFRDAFNGCICLELLDRDPADSEKPLVRARPENPPLLLEHGHVLDRDACAGDSDVGMAAIDQLPSTGSIGGEGAGFHRFTGERSETGAAFTTVQGGEEERLGSLHAAHSKVVRIHVMDFPGHSRLDDATPAGRSLGAANKRDLVDTALANSQCSTRQSQPVISLTFRLHSRLGFVTVSCESNMEPPFTADDLCLLFPCDYGLTSPNLSNAHLLGGRFQFRQELVPENGRPYLWANLLCCLHFPGAVQESVDVSAHLPAEFQEWCTVAAKYPTHLRFKDVLTAIGGRLDSVRSVRAQLASLSKMQLPLSWQHVGLPKASSANITTFAPCPPDLDNTGLEIAAGSSETCTAAWAFHVMHPCGIWLAGMLGIQPNYPLTAGIFRLKSVPDAAVSVAEADIRDMESEVSVYGDKFTRDEKIAWDREERPLVSPSVTASHQHIHQANCKDANMILSKQILKLLVCVDVVASAMNEQELANAAELDGGYRDGSSKELDDHGAPLEVMGDSGIECDGRSRDAVDGMVGADGKGKERRGRSARGRARSKMYRT